MVRLVVAFGSALSPDQVNRHRSPLIWMGESGRVNITPRLFLCSSSSSSFAAVCCCLECVYFIKLHHLLIYHPIQFGESLVLFFFLLFCCLVLLCVCTQRHVVVTTHHGGDDERSACAPSSKFRDVCLSLELARCKDSCFFTLARQGQSV